MFSRVIGCDRNSSGTLVILVLLIIFEAFPAAYHMQWVPTCRLIVRYTFCCCLYSKSGVWRVIVELWSTKYAQGGRVSPFPTKSQNHPNIQQTFKFTFIILLSVLYYMHFIVCMYFCCVDISFGAALKTFVTWSQFWWSMPEAEMALFQVITFLDSDLVAWYQDYPCIRYILVMYF